MKELQLKMKPFNTNQILSRLQLKQIMGGGDEGSIGDGKKCEDMSGQACLLGSKCPTGTHSGFGTCEGILTAVCCMRD